MKVHGFFVFPLLVEPPEMLPVPEIIKLLK